MNACRDCDTPVLAEDSSVDFFLCSSCLLAGYNEQAAALDALTAERDRLRAALSALVERHKPTEDRWGRMGCDECGSEWDETETHGSDCRWAKARDALEGSK